MLPMGSTPLSNRYRVDAGHRNGSHFFVRQLPQRAQRLRQQRMRTWKRC